MPATCSLPVQLAVFGALSPHTLTNGLETSILSKSTVTLASGVLPKHDAKRPIKSVKTCLSKTGAAQTVETQILFGNVLFLI